MKLFLAYIRHHNKHIAMLALFACVFAAVLYLYTLPVEAVAYAAILCAAIGFVFFLYGLNRFRKKHKYLLEMENHLGESIDSLPPPAELIEADYQRLLRALFALKVEADARAQARYQDQSEYYTLWAHQIKTPISAARLLLQSGDAPADALLEQLFAIEQYVETALQYLRMESMSSDLLIRQVPLHDLVKQAVRKYAKLFIHKQIALNLAPIENTVLTDEKWLVFVLEQILSNALKYTRSGTITIHCEPDDTLVIADTGIGIRAEDLPRVFERGYTGFNGRADKRSTGIGLYLCSEILRRLSHGIAIESEVNRGTRVKLFLRADNVEIE